MLYPIFFCKKIYVYYAKFVELVELYSLNLTIACVMYIINIVFKKNLFGKN